MSVYLIDEKVLWEVLAALGATQPYLHLECTAQRLVNIAEDRISNILAYPPAEPVAWEWRVVYSNGGYTRYLCHDEQDALGYNDSLLMDGVVTPLYRKDL